MKNRGSLNLTHLPTYTDKDQLCSKICVSYKLSTLPILAKSSNQAEVLVLITIHFSKGIQISIVSILHSKQTFRKDGKELNKLGSMAYDKCNLANPPILLSLNITVCNNF